MLGAEELVQTPTPPPILNDTRRANRPLAVPFLNAVFPHMQVLLISLGSMGDTLPFVALGQALLARGHRVTLMANGHYQTYIEGQGVPFVEGLTAAEFQEYARIQVDWTFRQSLEATGQMLLGQLRKAYDFVAQHSAGGDTVVAAQAYALGARVAQEKLGVPLATVHVQPLWFRSAYSSPVLPRWLPRLVPRAFDRLLDLAVDTGLGPPVNAFRAEFGLPPAKRLLKQWWNSPNMVLGLFPEWYDPPQPDWPLNTVLTGFPLLKRQPPALSAELQAFLAAGTPPLLFTQTSVSKQVRVYFEASAAAAQALGRRAIFLTPHEGQIPPSLPETIRRESFVPLDALLPHCAAHVHHGGIGTIAETLLAGVPQLTVPMVNDQNDNSLRLLRLGASAYLKPAAYTADRAAEVLRQLLDSADVQARCRELSARCRQHDSLAVACDALERLLPTGKRNQ